jgi:hypothetical protein
LTLSISENIAYAQQQEQEQQRPNINANNLYEIGKMVLGNNIKHLVILIPNEGHHEPGEEDEARFIAQSFIPQNAVVSPGTQIIWFNADVDHDHKITLSNNANPQSVLFDSALFAFNKASRPVVLNDTGTFDYYEANVNEEYQDFVMRGNVAVSNMQQQQQQLLFSNTSSNNNNIDIVGTYMVPTQDLDTIHLVLKL